MHSASATMHSLDWADLHYALVIAEHGSLAAAARVLAVNHTTVLRRIRAFEQRLGVRLFERLPTGYALSAAGEEIAAAARQMQALAADVERRVAGRDLRLTGTVRVTTTDTLAESLVPSALTEFSREHPQVKLELTTTTTHVSLTKRDADVAVRATRSPPEHLVGRRIAAVAYALYASPGYLKRAGARRDLLEHVWLAPDDSLAGTTIAHWMRAELKQARVVFRADTLSALCHAAGAGLGVTALPCFVGDRARGLRRLGGVIPQMETDLWVLTHEDLKNAARIRALVAWLVRALDGHRDLLEGRGKREKP